MVEPTREFGWAGVKLPTSDDRQNFDPLAVVCWMMEAATAKETDTQKAKVFLTSAFGIRFA